MTSINICIIEDEPEILETLKSFFELKGHNVIGFESSEDFEATDQSGFHGLYLVDWNLPGKNGIDLIREIRKNDSMSPIFIVSGFGQKDQIIQGLNAGADDYITKPFNFDELHARAANSFKKFDLFSKSNDAGEATGIRLLPEANSFMLNDQVVSLTHREYIIFSCMFQHCNEPVSREELLDEFSGDDNMTIRNIDVHVFSLRKKIKTVDLYIQTIRGVGYQLSPIS